MDLKLKNKTALITGSTAGIGLAIAKALYAEGASVIVNGRSEERVSHAIQELKKIDSIAPIKGIAADLSTKKGFDELIKKFPSVDILINNLGVFEAKILEEIKDEDWSRMFDVNVLSGARISNHYLKEMKAQNWGRIIFIASEAGVNIPPDMIHYGVSKAAQMALARGIAETTVGTAVTVNSILPGPTHSEGVNKFLDDVIKSGSGDRGKVESEFLNQLRPTSLIKRFAGSEEVANLVTYIASPLSSATNGAALRVEGGLLRGVL